MISTTWSPKRRAEFVTGRACARTALAALGAPPASIGQAPDRSPCWPSGYVGSISHSDYLAVAVAASAASFRSIGVDLEPDTPLASSLISIVTHARDRLSEDGVAIAAKKVFVAKEAYFKAYYPLQRRFLDFTDVFIALDTPTVGNFTASLCGERLERESSSFAMTGTMNSFEGHYLAVVSVVSAGSGTEL